MAQPEFLVAVSRVFPRTMRLTYRQLFVRVAARCLCVLRCHTNTKLQLGSVYSYT